MTRSLSSMTGFARANGAVEDAAFTCEIKSVNGRGLDMRLRLAPGLDELEGEIRQRIARTLTLSLDRDGASGELVVNHSALQTVLDALNQLRGKVAADPPTLDGILALPGVLVERDGKAGMDKDLIAPVVLGAVSRAIEGLVAARRVEGAAIQAVLMQHLDDIDSLVAHAQAHPARSREVIAEKLRLQIAALAAETELPPDRLAQEALLLATKADIQEELDRLRAHSYAARTLIEAGGPAGRKLDFLAQEFNREANTLCSKANAVELTAIGLDLKAAIDQLREQVQNIE